MKRAGQAFIFAVGLYLIASWSMRFMFCSDICAKIGRYGDVSFFETNACTCYGRKEP